MTRQTQKLGRNLILKVAIVATGHSQRAVGLRVRIPEVRLSDIIRGRVEATSRERRALSRVLGRPVSELFPAPPEAMQERAS
jgi:hypothetical protein